MSKLILFNKPFQVLCQFRKNDDRKTLADFINNPDVHPAGRLDYDSEGLLLLTDDGNLNHQLAHPKFEKVKTYWVQVEGDITDSAINDLINGVNLKDGKTRPAQVRKIEQPDLWERVPPIRERQNIPTSWIEISITEGKNRQVRRMTAHVGFPTLRLIRARIGDWNLDAIGPGEFVEIDVKTAAKAPSINHRHKKTGHKSRFSKTGTQSGSGSKPKDHSQRRNQSGRNQNRKA